MKILVCGGREYDSWDEVSRQLDHLFYEWLNLRKDKSSDFVIITGDAKGADWLARAWAKFGEDFVKYRGYPADWKKHGRAAGPIRNQEMLDKEKPDLVVAFPGGTGTADMVYRAKKAGVSVVEVKE